MVDIYRYRGSDLSYEFKKIPNVEVAIVTLRGSDRRGVTIPGIVRRAPAEIMLFKDEFSLANNLSELGDCFVLDSFKDIPDSKLAGKLRIAILTDARWNTNEVFYAVPLEMVKGGRYRMDSYSMGSTLFNCSSTTLFDSEVGTFNCLESCLYQVDYLMGGCTLGVRQCSEGLYDHVSTNKEIVSQQPQD
jgi:hypothetical protein